MYQELFNLLHQYLYGSQALTSDMSLTLTILSTIGVLFVALLPFLVVYKVIEVICSSGR